MYKRLVGCVLLANIVLAIVIPTTLLASPSDETPWWNDDWSFRKELIIPIDTGSEYARYQPVDIYIEFNDSCWVKNEEEHSIRVIFQDESRFIPLESQIYNLTFLDDEHIDSCNLVFLIPKEANGEEKYYVYYDDGEKSGPKYPNRVDIGEDYYRYEQIPGLLFESSYYKITEGDYIVYAVNKEGSAFGDTISQQIAKLKKETEDVMPKNGEQLASFDFIYWWNKNRNWYLTSTSERLVKHKRFVDGNLMVKFGIESASADGLLKSTVIYKYYYCPTEDKRIYIHVKHEIVDYPLPLGDKIDAGYVTLVSGSVESSSIEDLNFGRILPYLHFYSDEERIIPYDVDPYPEGKKYQRIIDREDDCDLGSFAWVSFDEGKSGKAHAIIFEANKVLKSGTDEPEGIGLQLLESNAIQLPGVNSRLAVLYMMRNSYEEGEKPDIELPENYVVEFNAEFFTTENGGYPTVEEEAKMYQSLIRYQPTNGDDITNGEEETEKFNLTAYVHLAQSFPFGSLLSTGLGWNVSYLSAEVYKENSYTSTGSISRLPLLEDIPVDFMDMSLVEKIKAIFRLFDWKNFSFFKKAYLSNLEAGRYLIKIFRENPFLEKERQFIGFTIVNLDKDMSTHIYCKPEGKISFSVLNQDGNGIKNAQIYLKKDDIIIAKSESDSNGKAVIKAPCGLRQTYTLNVTYKGFLINKEQIRLGIIRRIIPLKKTLKFDVYDLNVSIMDSKGEIPAFDVDFSLTSDEMQVPVNIKADSVSDGVHKFNDLYPANYTLTINYNSFEIREKIQIPGIESMSIKLYDFTAYIKDSWSLAPGATLDVTLTSKDFEKNVVMTGEKLSAKEHRFTDLYPGNYRFKARYKTFTIEELISIPDKENITIMFPAVFNVTATIVDSRGNPLKDAKVLIIREEKEVQGITDDNGEVIFSLPPGYYDCKVYSNGNLIAKRRVEVFNEKTYTIATTDDPLLPFIIIGLTTAVLVGVAVISYRRKNAMFFLKILAVALAVIAIVSPWWAVHGSSSDSQTETSTKLFLMPTKMVIITSNDNVTAGWLMPLDGNLKKEFDLLFTTVVIEFEFVIDLLPMIIVAAIIFIISSLIITRYYKRSLPLVVLLSAIIFLVGSIAMFSLAMSELANVTVGSFIGDGNLNIDIPGEKISETIFCSWGPNIGFYLILGSIIILMFAFYLNLKKIKQQK
jgi:hypothetical protein